MSVITARSTKKYFTGNDLLRLFPDTQGIYLPLIEELIHGYHPLPALYITVDNKGVYSLLGEYSHNIVMTVKLITVNHNDVMVVRRVKKYTFDIIIFEPCDLNDQADLIAAYQQLGFC